MHTQYARCNRLTAPNAKKIYGMAKSCSAAPSPITLINAKALQRAKRVMAFIKMEGTSVVRILTTNAAIISTDF